MGFVAIQNKLKPNHNASLLKWVPTKWALSKLCTPTPPNIGAVTSIGPCHLERFGSMENIAKGKSELLAAIEQNTSPLALASQKNFLN